MCAVRPDPPLAEGRASDEPERGSSASWHAEDACASRPEPQSSQGLRLPAPMKTSASSQLFIEGVCVCVVGGWPRRLRKLPATFKTFDEWAKRPIRSAVNGSLTGRRSRLLSAKVCSAPLFTPGLGCFFNVCSSESRKRQPVNIYRKSAQPLTSRKRPFCQAQM